MLLVCLLLYGGCFCGGFYDEVGYVGGAHVEVVMWKLLGGGCYC